MTTGRDASISAATSPVRVIGEVLDGTADVSAEIDAGALPFEGRIVTDMTRLLRYRRRLLAGD